jgi:hypothetical protein
MLILQAVGRRAVINTPAREGCGCAHLVDSYVWRCLAPRTRNEFELHMMECSSCLSSVELEQVSGRAIRNHKTSRGIPCATRVRRIR